MLSKDTGFPVSSRLERNESQSSTVYRTEEINNRSNSYIIRSKLHSFHSSHENCVNRNTATGLDQMSSNSTEVYVGSLPNDTTQEQVQDVFGKFGAVRVDVRRNYAFLVSQLLLTFLFS